MDSELKQLEKNVEVIMLTPELAKKFLSEQRGNRNIKRNNLYKLINDLEAGRFVFNGDPLRFDKRNHMGDGQHRCVACEKTGISFPVLVVRNLPDEAFPTMDIGASRTAGDIFTFSGIKNSNATAAGIRVYLAFKQSEYNTLFLGGSSTTTMKVDGNRIKAAFTNPQLLSEYNENPNLWDEISQSALSYVRPLTLLNPGFAIGFYAFLLIDKKHTTEEINIFFEGLLGKRDSEYEIINLMKDKLKRRKNEGYFIDSSKLLGLLSKTWNYYLTGVQKSSLSYNKDKEGVIKIL